MRDSRFEWTAVAVAIAAAIGFAWLAWALGRGELTAFDDAYRAGLHSFAGPSLTQSMRVVTLLGSQIVVLTITACAAFFLFSAGRRSAGALILIAMAGAEVLEAGLKAQFHRQRPEPFFDTILPGSYSFPSGHALLSLCLYGVLAWLIGARLSAPARRGIRASAVVLILIIGASRVYLGVHYPSDVIGGFLAAIAWIAALRAARVGVSTMDT